MTLLKDLIDIPERVHQGDFVLKLAEGVARPAETLRDYVVTPELAVAFANALGLIQQAVSSGSSKAAYLHGSFGSGKSHFMAVLNLLLAGHAQARAIPELAGAVAQATWTQGRRFLMVPYHMIGERDMESAILGQYAEHVRRLHPDAPVPGFYQAEEMFRDARAHRAHMGDTAFFARLNAGRASADDGWGKLDQGWDAGSFEVAMMEPPHGPERARLVGDLIAQYFTAYGRLATGGEAYVPLDDGLAIMSRHARGLGYDAVILFLDEMVLWLASHAADVNFVSREGVKLVKLVEATHAERPVPLVSFVARQRDLRELVGENMPGSLGVQFTDVLRFYEARFHRITLEDRNLPAIAERRVLRPVNDAARQTLQVAFEDVLRLRRDVLDTLMTSEADRDMFRRVYPFTPALVQTLIAVSAALQRERTALKLMMQLLVDRRDELALGQLIPVGDLWDVIAEGDEPFSDAMRVHFDNAKRLYAQRLLPMLEARHGTTWEAIRLRQADPAAARALRNDARLIKTLLLAALVPQVESLRALTAQRLAALNHGTFRTPIPGQEAQQVLRKLKEWAAEVGEIKVPAEDANPLVSIQITGVDLEPVLGAAASNDNPGNRKKMVRELLFQQLGLHDTGGMFVTYAFNWRGTRREVELLLENVLEMSDERLKGRSGGWTVVLDFPFDEPHRTPQDDLARLNAYRGGSTRTLAWLASFLTPAALNDLGRFVVLDHILTGTRFETYAGSLSAIERAQAQALAANLRDSLRAKLCGYLDMAYGVAPQPAEAVTQVLHAQQQFRSLDPTLAVRPPVGADFRQAFENLLDQLLQHQYPAHPQFDTDIKPAAVKRVWQELKLALEDPQHRGHVEDAAARRLVRSIAVPLQLVQMGEAHLVLDPHWQNHFNQRAAAESGAAITVGRLREWMDVPRPMGLPVELQNLVILTVAAQTNRRLVYRGGPFDGEVDRLPDEVELREQALPPQPEWELAVQRAAALFGLVVPQSRNAANVGKLVAEVKRAVGERQQAVADLVASLADRASRHAPGEPGARQRTAQSAQALLAALAGAQEAAVVSTLAQATLETSEAALGRALGQAATVVAALTQTQWQLFDAVRGLADQRREAGQAIAGKLAEVLRHDEHVIPLKLRLDELARDAVRLLAVPVAAPAPPVAPAPPPTVAPTPPGRVLVESAEQAALSGAAAAALLQDLQRKLAEDDTLELSLQWRLHRKQGR